MKLPMVIPARNKTILLMKCEHIIENFRKIYIAFQHPVALTYHSFTHTHTQLMQHGGNTQTNIAYSNNDNNITTASVKATLKNTQNTDAAGGKERGKITTSNALQQISFKNGLRQMKRH
jgi:hypothetical protein